MAREIPPITFDFDGADLGDRRLAARLTWMAEALAARPDQPLPDVFLTEAGLEAGYRFFNNGRVTPAGILAPHIEATVARSRCAERLLVLHDTTLFHFDGRGFGPLRGATLGEGFFGHVALAVDGVAERAPLGVLGLCTFERTKRPRGRRKTEAERRDDNELRHWAELFEKVRDALGDARAVHVMDRQADSYALFSTMFGRADFVVRAAHDRIASSDGERVRSVLAEQPVVLERTVSITAREGTGLNRDRHQPARDERSAVLHVTAAAIDLPRPRDSHGSPRATTPAVLPLHLVRVYEPNPPDGERPIECKRSAVSHQRSASFRIAGTCDRRPETTRGIPRAQPIVFAEC